MSTATHPSAHPEWERIQRLALIAAGGGTAAFVVIGLVLSLAFGLIGPLQFFLSYLVAYTFWLSIALGCLVILMLQYLTGGAWGIVIRRVLESSTRTLWLLAPLFLPIFFGMVFLYLWAQPEHYEHDAELAQKREYLNGFWFVVRTLVYFAVWLALAFFLNRWSGAQDRQEPGAADLARRFRNLSAPGLVLYGATITLASIDWVMSLEPYWYSTIYPVLFATSQILTGFAFAIAVLILLATYPPLSEIVKPAHLNDLGSLLLAFVMFWAYMSFSQFLLIWVGNLPEEIPWYLKRSEGGWQWVAIVVALFHFVLPFLLLLSRDVKRNRRRLATLAVGLLVMRFIDIFWWIEPAYPHEDQYGFWLLDIAAVIGLGGLWVWWFVWQLKRRPLVPIHDPYLLEAIHHESHE